MAKYLRAGAPLRQYIGFALRADAIIASDPSISAVAVFDHNHRRVFIAGEESTPFLQRSVPLGEESEFFAIDIRQNDEFLQVVLPLSNKFEYVGDLVVTTPLGSINEMPSPKRLPSAPRPLC